MEPEALLWMRKMKWEVPDYALEMARTKGAVEPNWYRVVVLGATLNLSSLDLPTLTRAIAYADDAASESDLGESPLAYVFDDQLRFVDRGMHYLARCFTKDSDHVRSMSRNFLDLVQSRVARVAVSASASRGRGNSGVVTAARRYLRKMHLAEFGVSPKAFGTVLNRETQKLCNALPADARHWGLARKLLNIFLRDCLYTIYLHDAYNLGRVEQALEIPLDSISVKHLKQELGSEALPQWLGVKHLKPKMSQTIQRAAQNVADKKGIARVHLDAEWWSMSRDEA